MAKMTYGIPASLDDSILDTEIPIQSQDGIGFKAVPLKVFLLCLGSAFCLMLFLGRSFIGKSGFVIAGAFSVIWIMLTALLVRFDKSRRMGVQLVAPLMNYLDRSSRLIRTRKNDDSFGFISVLGLARPFVEDDGLIYFADGALGYAYRITGSASVLLFEEDRNEILNRVDAYYRKMDTQVEHIFLTTKESQKVHNQLVALNHRYQALEHKDPDLVGLVRQQEATLNDYVGGRFRSIHQYLVIRGANREALDVGTNALMAEAENSGMMIRRYAPMYGDEVQELFAGMYA